MRTEKKTPQHKSTYTINTTCNRGKHIQHWQAAIRSGAICGAGHRPARQRGGTKRSEAVWSGEGSIMGIVLVLLETIMVSTGM